MFLQHAIELRESIFAPQLVQCAQKQQAKAFEESVSGPVAQAPDPIRAISPAREERRGRLPSRLTISASQIVRNGRPANSRRRPAAHGNLVHQHQLEYDHRGASREPAGSSVPPPGLSNRACGETPCSLRALPAPAGSSGPPPANIPSLQSTSPQTRASGFSRPPAASDKK